MFCVDRASFIYRLVALHALPFVVICVCALFVAYIVYVERRK